MMRFRLTTVPWTLLRAEDFAAMWRSGSVCGGYMNAGSLQACMYDAGTLAQASLLREHLRRLTVPAPSTQQAARVFREVQRSVPSYRFDADGESWWIRNTSQPRFDTPLAGDWHLAFLTNEAAALVIRDGELATALSLFPYLDGTLDLDGLLERACASPITERLLQFLVEHSLLEVVPPHDLQLDQLPEFLFLAHAGFGVRADDALLVVDPLVVPALGRFDSNRDIYRLLGQARAIAISHHHWDHLHLQTLARIRRDMRFVVPKVQVPSFANPPTAPYLRALGFHDVVEVGPDQRVEVGAIELHTAPFFGESFGLQSHFDAFTYDIRFSNTRVVGTVDACHDEEGDMTATIENLARGGPVDLYLYGSSSQRHDPLYVAAGLRHFSNELVLHPTLARYHPDTTDVAKWLDILRPDLAAPYAQFLLEAPTHRFSDVTRSTAHQTWSTHRASVPRKHEAWASTIDQLATESRVPMAYFTPMQGLRMAAASTD
jgi:L-ascorbate metabolism protein UlaG (beta-lactamase superfamily)